MQALEGHARALLFILCLTRPLDEDLEIVDVDSTDLCRRGAMPARSRIWLYMSSRSMSTR